MEVAFGFGESGPDSPSLDRLSPLWDLARPCTFLNRRVCESWNSGKSLEVSQSPRSESESGNRKETPVRVSFSDRPWRKREMWRICDTKNPLFFANEAQISVEKSPPGTRRQTLVRISRLSKGESLCESLSLSLGARARVRVLVSSEEYWTSFCVSFSLRIHKAIRENVEHASDRHVFSVFDGHGEVRKASQRPWQRERNANSRNFSLNLPNIEILRRGKATVLAKLNERVNSSF